MTTENKVMQSLPEHIKNILQQFVDQSVKTYAPHIRKIILYGSYARGDYSKDSDVDIMVLVDYPRESISDLDGRLSDIGYELSFENDFLEISTLMQNIDFFNKWISAYPFYNNVNREGVELYAG